MFNFFHLNIKFQAQLHALASDASTYTQVTFKFPDRIKDPFSYY